MSVDVRKEPLIPLYSITIINNSPLSSSYPNAIAQVINVKLPNTLGRGEVVNAEVKMGKKENGADIVFSKPLFGNPDTRFVTTAVLLLNTELCFLYVCYIYMSAWRNG